MKFPLFGQIIAVGFACVGVGHATSVTAAGGGDGYTFGYEIAGVFTAFNSPGAAPSDLQVGRIDGGSSFIEFPAPGDTLGFSDGVPFFVPVGKWEGSASTDSDTPTFTGQQILFQVTTTIGGTLYTGMFGSDTDPGAGTTFATFPANDLSGGTDDVSVLSTSLVFLPQYSTGLWEIDTVAGTISLVIPEPSSLILGSLGGLFLIRRRRA